MTRRFTTIALGVALLVLPACTGLGRRANQALPEFMRGEAGSEEKERIAQLRARLEAPAGASAARTRAFEGARNCYESRRFSDAADRFEDFLDDYPSSEYDEEARFLLGRAHDCDGEWSNAFSAYKDYMERYPVSNRAPEVEERTFHMGCAYLAGKRKSFLGIFSNVALGEEMFIWLVQTFPNGARADDAQWRLARHYVCEGDWAKATAAFDFLVKQYPNSEWYSASVYYTGYTRYRQVKGTRYDQAIVRESRKRFVEYAQKYPDGTWRADAERLICVLDNIAAQKLLNVAQWYVDRGRPWSARYYLVRLQKLHPDTNAAVCGSRLLARLPVTPPCPGEFEEVITRIADDTGVPESDTRPAAAPESAPAGPP